MKRKNANPVEAAVSVSIEDAVRTAIAEDAAIDGQLFELDVLESIDAHILDFVGCTFRRVQFSDIRVSRVHFANCRFEQCDLSGLPFKDGTLTRVEFIGCRGTGCTFDHMKMKDVLFRDAQLNYLTLAACQAERVEFEGCDLSHAMLLESTQKDFVLTRCRLSAAEIQGTSLKDVDLSDCELDGISVRPENLRGTTISLTQAPSLLAVFGVQVKL